MATPSDASKKRRLGIIILGNTGPGKSYIGNLLCGREVFKSSFQAKSVTREAVSETIKLGEYEMDFVDTPGLVELDQKKIENNIAEIEKAFQMNPISVVIFVWSQTNGRPSPVDIIAFKSLFASYQFPRICMLHIINNVPKEEASDSYKRSFVDEVAGSLISYGMDVTKTPLHYDNFILVKHIKPIDTNEINEMREDLSNFMKPYCAAMQKQIKPIELSVQQVVKEVEKLISADRNKLRAAGAAALSLNQVGAGAALLGGFAAVAGGAYVTFCDASIITIGSVYVLSASSPLGPAVWIGGLAALSVGALLLSINQ
ncbi:unnamed protein product [Adineta steineri]|uniref:AIG1-type G domain-containing protein n=1 Tax=Adineta steineri TaxID=433720 RepID=A0A815GTV8_9BILA|nr:unnamed protein product [Adineta steineri]CAF1342868.1 unnamed protein product [Adineta steineri]CAF3540500.1 unnamed protein product [Adineta steineri]CAF3821502.1 unnamed protein product [Adineta steineri]